jgi:hypothetical protein
MGWMDRVDEQHGLVRAQAIQEIFIGRDERRLLALVKVATDDSAILKLARRVVVIRFLALREGGAGW